jgi:hypothetical protein
MESNDLLKTLTSISIDHARTCALILLRQDMQDLYFEIGAGGAGSFIDIVSSTSGKSRDQIEQENEHEFKSYLKVKRIAIDVFYKFTPGNGFFPSWLPEDSINKFHDILNDFAPFTVLSFESKDNLKMLGVAARDFITAIDQGMKSNV